MLPIFTKPVGEIQLEDVHELIDEAYPETDTVEYKGKLPHKRGNHPWYGGAKNISFYTRREILKEAVAFANSQGGTLLLGIEQSDDRPHRAADVCPIPHCHELADRLRKQARDSIRPLLPTIAIAGVAFEEGDPDNSGIVVLSVPASRLAPHRLEMNQHKECYRRHNDRAETMSMREIQELTLRRARVEERIDQAFQERRERFGQLITEHSERHFDGKSSVAVRITLLPTSADLYVDDLNESDITPPLYGGFNGELGDRKVELILPSIPVRSGCRPMLGGVECNDIGRIEVRVEVTRTGLIEYALIDPVDEPDEPRDNVLVTDWFLALLTNALITAHRFRAASGSPAVEYGLEVEIRIPTSPFTLTHLGLGTALTPRMRGTIPTPLLFPRRSVGSPDEFSRLVHLVFRDLQNAVGNELEEKLLVRIPEEHLQLP